MEKKHTGLGILNVECKCHQCPENDLKNGKWCKKGIDPSKCAK